MQRILKFQNSERVRRVHKILGSTDFEALNWERVRWEERNLLIGLLESGIGRPTDRILET